MGSLAVLMKIGLFSTKGGTATEPVYEIASPIFNKITIHLDERFYQGDQFIIEAKDNSKENVYVNQATLDGKALKQPWFYHKDLVEGGKLILEMSNTADERFNK